MISGENLKAAGWKIWWLAARPKTLPAAASGVITGAAVALYEGRFQPGPAFAALLAALLLQIGSNLANDVFDFERGTDAAERHGPLRVTQAGLLTPSQVKAGMWTVFALAALLGVYLILVSGWPVVVIGLLAIIVAIAYTGGPFPLGYYGLGDLFVFLFFGPAAVAGTYYIQTRSVSALAWWLSVPVGLIVTAILVVNNLRDIDTDRAARKHTLAVLLGRRGAQIEYTLCLTIAFLWLPILAWLGLLPWLSLLAWVALPLAWRASCTVFTRQGCPLNAALADTGQLALAFSLLCLASMLLAR